MSQVRIGRLSEAAGRRDAAVGKPPAGAPSDAQRIADLEAQLKSARTQAGQIESLRKLGSWEIDLDNDALRWSEGTYRIFRLPPGEPVTVARALSFYPPDARGTIADALALAVASGTPYDVTLPFVAACGTPGWVRTLGRVENEGGRRRLVGVIEDVSAEKVAQDDLMDLAYRDALTALPNRRAFQACLAAIGGRSAGLFLLDIDHFKTINDTAGHPAGDELLCRVAERLAACVRPGDMVARLGGDEFGIVLAGVEEPEALEQKADGFLEAVRQGIRIRDGIVNATASIGIAQTVRGSASAEALLQQADIALYRAKAQGRDRAQLFGTELGTEVEHHASVLKTMGRAIAGNELEVFYQPIVDLRTEAVRGLEALVRWNHPERGILAPAAFEAALGDPVLSVAIDDFVLHRALEQLRAWLDAGVPVSAVNVNASVAQLRRADLAERVGALLARNGLTPDRLKFEVVETAFLGRDTARVAATIARLAAMGVVCALDDFGTGFSSLSHLKQFRVERIKIDRSFVASICSDAFDRGLVRSLVELGRNIGMRITAEGVETAEQLALLREFGCDCAQGYLIGRPVPASEVPAVLKRWPGKAA